MIKRTNPNTVEQVRHLHLSVKEPLVNSFPLTQEFEVGTIFPRGGLTQECSDSWRRSKGKGVSSLFHSLQCPNNNLFSEKECPQVRSHRVTSSWVNQWNCQIYLKHNTKIKLVDCLDNLSQWGWWPSRDQLQWAEPEIKYFRPMLLVAVKRWDNCSKSSKCKWLTS